MASLRVLIGVLSWFFGVDNVCYRRRVGTLATNSATVQCIGLSCRPNCHFRMRRSKAMSRTVLSFARPSDSGRREPINDCDEAQCATTAVGPDLRRSFDPSEFL